MLQNLCLYRGTYTRTGTYIYLISPVEVYKTYAYIEVPLGTTKLILIPRRLHLFGGTHRYYRDITEHILVLRNLFLYGSTRKYYLFKCLKRHIFVHISNLYIYLKVPVGATNLYSYEGTHRYYGVYPYPELIRRYP